VHGRWHARVALLIQHAARHDIAICGLWIHRIFRRYLTNGMIFEKKVVEHKMCVLISFPTFI
jgi:hypothetical protein